MLKGWDRCLHMMLAKGHPKIHGQWILGNHGNEDILSPYHGFSSKGILLWLWNPRQFSIKRA